LYLAGDVRATVPQHRQLSKPAAIPSCSALAFQRFSPISQHNPLSHSSETIMIHTWRGSLASHSEVFPPAVNLNFIGTDALAAVDQTRDVPG
jgi:hypothetical protein